LSRAIEKKPTGLRFLGAIVPMPMYLSSYTTGCTTIRRDSEVKELEICKKILGAEHPNTLISMNNVALRLKKQGRVAEAIKLLEECVQLQMLVLGADHPRALSSTRTLTKWKSERLRYIEINALATKGVERQ